MKRISVGDFHLGDEEKKAIMDVLDSGRISEDQKVRDFERLWSRYINTRYSVALSSGTAALIVGWISLLHYKNSKSSRPPPLKIKRKL